MGWQCRLGGLQKVKLRCAEGLMALSVASAFERRQLLGYLGSEDCVPIAALPGLCCSAAAVGGACVTLCGMGEALG